ncbi:transmembrane protein, putative (macronuclear) [Tetrahymena thermophila SB210]|uniref:Transmembrane protein, putative n=1 Tax=Tetrahymena thermophila (strain SB210) TaxID=312017 RepID=W7WZR0_TETTS|nr:transmembrane protein, putative [Tetrahymena thermophila SB210]EWS72330.1 transmembrane protein, putative [Tetrahymena thermophila SB210]|eukprot:XP_012655138.1 transmembrane protein, putative [Tetrahymena thermophila SB210]
MAYTLRINDKIIKKLCVSKLKILYKQVIPITIPQKQQHINKTVTIWQAIVSYYFLYLRMSLIFIGRLQNVEQQRIKEFSIILL